MRNMLFIGILILLTLANYSMDNSDKEEFNFKVINKTPNWYYLKIPEEFVAEKDYKLSYDEYQRWLVRPEHEEDVAFSLPRDSAFSLAIQIKSLCAEDKKDTDESDAACLANMVLYKNPYKGQYFVHFRPRFQSSVRVESEQFANKLTLLIRKKSSGMSLLQLCK